MTDKLWEAEPDTFDFDYAGRRCAMRRNNGGAWCGYTEILPGEKLFGKGYDALIHIPEAKDKSADIDKLGALNILCGVHKAEPEKGIYPLSLLVECHGGLTYADEAFWARGSSGWWFGFDCSHAGDLSPKYPHNEGEVYRDIAYVQSVICEMVDQLAWVQEKGEVVNEQEPVRG